jgi:aspartyl aminopeptidase
MNRSANDGMKYQANVDTYPLFGDESAAGGFMTAVAQAAGVDKGDILGHDLFLYCRQKGTLLGDKEQFIHSPKLDDLECAWGLMQGFLKAQTGGSIPVCCVFDNEEVGSETKQGAASTFLYDVLNRISAACGLDSVAMARRIAASFLVSCDNAHAVHPNHPEYQDKNHAVYMNGGVVIKYNANQKYTSDAVSAGIFGLICEGAGVPVQRYANRADMAGGSTLGNIANTQVSLNTVDIGLPQLAMHSAYETAGAKDTAYMVKALTAFFGTEIRMDADGMYEIR